MNKRIAICITTYLPSIGGAELAVQALIKHLPNYDFEIITSRYDAAGRHFDKNLPTSEMLDGVQIRRVGNSFLLSKFLVPKALLPLAIFWQLWQSNRRQPFDLVFAIQASQAAGGAWLFSLVKPKIPLLINIQEGNDLARQSWLKRLFRKMLLRRAHHITVLSNYLEKVVVANRVSTTRISIIPNGVELYPKPAVIEVQNLRDKLDLRAGPSVVITLSRLVPKNGLDILLKAISLLPETTLLIAGDGPQRQYLENLTHELNLNERVKFLGTLAPVKLPLYLALADVFVRPSRTEGFGIAFLDAMSAGVPVVTTPVGGIVDFIKDGETGLLCPPESPAAIAAAIKRFLMEPELKEKIIKNSLQLVIERYTWDKIAAQYSELLKNLMT